MHRVCVYTLVSYTHSELSPEQATQAGDKAATGGGGAAGKCRRSILPRRSVESGIGWIPFVLEAMDYQFQGNSVAEEHPEFEMLPSQYFARNVYACYWFEQTAPRRLIDKIGVDNVLFETDFPHPTSLYGDEVHARIKGGLSDCEESVRRKILWSNAEKLYKVEAPTATDEAKRAAAACDGWPGVSRAHRAHPKKRAPTVSNSILPRSRQRTATDLVESSEFKKRTCARRYRDAGRAYEKTRSSAGFLVAGEGFEPSTSGL